MKKIINRKQISEQVDIFFDYISFQRKVLDEKNIDEIIIIKVELARFIQKVIEQTLYDIIEIIDKEKILELSDNKDYLQRRFENYGITCYNEALQNIINKIKK